MKLSKIAMAGLLATAVTAPAHAISWGQPDGDGHPNVVTLLFIQKGEGFYGCTGTLLTPYVVLTAGHCTEGAGQANDATWVRNDFDIDAAIASELPSYGGGLEGLLAWLNDTWSSGRAVPHPDFDDYAQFPDTYDIGVVLLDRPIYVSEYGALPSLRQFEYLRTMHGGQLVLGYPAVQRH